MANINNSFSCTDKEIHKIDEAREMAKRNRQSFSKLVMDAITAFIEREKNPELLAENQGISCLSSDMTRQTKIPEYLEIATNKVLELSDQELDNDMVTLQEQTRNEVCSRLSKSNMRLKEVTKTIESKGRVATDYERKLLKDYKSGKFGNVVTSQLRKLQQEIEEGLVIIQ